MSVQITKQNALVDGFDESLSVGQDCRIDYICILNQDGGVTLP